GREPVLAHLTALASSPTQQAAAWGVCLTANPGAGKSAIFGQLHRRLRQSQTFVLAHAADASLRSQSVEGMLRRWIEELGTAVGSDPDLPENADPEAIESTFNSLLGRMALQRRVVVLI